MAESASGEPLRCEDDQLHLPEIKQHSLEKIRHHNRCAEIFSAAMRKKWPQRAYIGLYSGAGRARLKGTDEIVETSALGVLRQKHPFTHYIYVDDDDKCTNALKARIANIGMSGLASVICDDVNTSAARVKSLLPSFSKTNGLLSFCFVDPFDIQFRFETIKQLSTVKLDFLILLMLGNDFRRNFQRYLDDPNSTRVADFIGCPNWREEFHAAGKKPIKFVLKKFDNAMTNIGYLSAGDELHPVKVKGMGVVPYMLALYSKKEIGKKLWREARVGLNDQLGLL